MTKEQEEAIEKLEYVNRYYDYNNYYSKYELDCIETVLNMLKEKDKEIKKKDKIIDLIAKYLAINGVERDICNEKRIKENCKNVTVDNITVHRCKECIKQYFERKSKNEN